MAKRKAPAGRKSKAARKPASRARKVARKTVARKPAAGKAVRKAAPKKAARKAALKKAARKVVAKKAARKAVAKKAVARKAVRRVVATQVTPQVGVKRPAAKPKPSPPAPVVSAPVLPPAPPAPAPAPSAPAAPAAAGASEAGPTEDDEEPLVPGAPSSLVPGRRPGRVRAVVSVEDEFTAELDEDGGLRAGDLDVNLEQAFSSGDETPGGDNPTPDQDVVDLIGRSLGVEYDDAEELRGAAKIEDRDRRRWELDPASAEDFKERKR